MRGLLGNLALALVWICATEGFTLRNFLAGIVVGGMIIWLCRGLVGELTYAKRMGTVFLFFFYYLWQVILATLRVAFDIITPRHYMRPAVVGIPLEARTDFEILLVGHLISLTPGTLTLEISEDRKVLYVHAMYLDEGDLNRFREDIKRRIERRVLSLTR